MKPEKPASYYDDHFESHIGFQVHYKKSYYYVHWTQVIVFLRKIAVPKILEVGCGTGQFAEYLKDEDFTDYSGFDFSSTAIEFAKRRVAMNFWQGDAHDRNNYKGEFNTLICLEVLEHIQNDLAVLSILPPKINIIFSVPNFDAPSHVRWFTSEREIKKRYFPYVDLKEIIRVGNIYLCRGVLNPFKPNLLQTLLATREAIGIGSFTKRFKHHLKNMLKLKDNRA
jgi:2-polyprenyl-3-methyl-5-hydroxy-6-metoxy-1,4-benzoquinol methylase